MISEADYQDIVAGRPGLTDECKRELRETGTFSPFDGRCYQTLPPRRWTGIWNAGWEWSNFCAAPARQCGVSARNGEMALQFADGAYPKGDDLDGTFEIAFIGRQTKHADGYGHLGQYQHMIMVDRLLAIRRLETSTN